MIENVVKDKLIIYIDEITFNNVYLKLKNG
jgi:hypothetical protein